MRALVFVLGTIGVVSGAFAGDFDSPFYDSDAAAARLSFETRFGGEHSAIAQRSFQLQLGSTRQVTAGLAPFRSEYRPATGQFLINGVDLAPMLMNRQVEEEGGIVGAWAGWLPLAIVLTGVTFVLVDGRDDGSFGVLGSGSGG